MDKLERDVWRQILGSYLRGHWRNAWRNTRFMLGMKIGGFTSATRDNRDPGVGVPTEKHLDRAEELEKLLFVDTEKQK